MIDGMSAVLKEEQKNDDAQKAFCDKDLEASAKEQKDTEESIATSEAFIEETTAASEVATEEIAALQKDIKALDKAVAEATEQRKEEHADFLQFQTENNAALQLIEKAKNRLFKFYRPNLHKEAPAQELTDEEKLLAASGASGVIALMEMLAKELEDGITESKHEEETSQKDYERLMADSQKTRAQNVESITADEAAKADLDTKIESTKQKKASQETELSNIKGYIAKFHANCDFLIENYDLRKAARANEVESLKNAKSVLSGANFA